MLARLRRLRPRLIAVACFTLSTIPLATHAQERATLSSQADAEKSSYRDAVSAAGRNARKRTEARDLHRTRLRRLLDDAATHPEQIASLDDEDFSALVSVETELGNWQRIVDAFDFASQRQRENGILLRRVINAQLQLGRLEQATLEFAALTKLNPADADAGALHINFAGAYEKTGQKAEAKAHLEAFMDYVVASLNRHPALGRSIPGLVDRYCRMAPQQHPFLTKLYANVSQAILGLDESMSPPPESSLAKVDALLLTATALAAEVERSAVGSHLQQWAQRSNRVVQSSQRLSSLDEEILLLMAEHFVRYSFLLRRESEADALKQAVAALANTAVARASASGRVPIRQAFSETVRTLNTRGMHIKCVGKVLSDADLLSLEVKPRGGIQEAVVLCFWSPFLADGRNVLLNVERVVQKHPGAQLTVILPYTRGKHGSEAAPAQREQALKQLREKLLADRDRPVALANMELAAIKRLAVGKLPQVVVIDKRSAIREIFVGSDHLRLAAFDRAIDEVSR